MGRQTHDDGHALGNSAEKMRISGGLLNAFRCREPQRTFPLIFFLFVALNVVVVTTGYISRVSSAECPSAAVPLKATMKTKLMQPEHQRRSAQRGWPEKNIDNLCTEIFIKIQKCGSSTNGGVARAIAAHRNLGGVHEGNVSSVACRVPEDEGCMVHANHGTASLFRKCRLEQRTPSTGTRASEGDVHREVASASTRVRQNSLLWTTIRDPRTRALSHYYQENIQTKDAKKPSEEEIIDWIAQVPGTFMFDYMGGLSVTPDSCQGTRTTQEGLSHDTADNQWANLPDDWDRGFVECKLNHLLDSYDFVGLIERQDESLVAMKLLFKLDFKDILKMSSKIRKDGEKLAADPQAMLQSYLDQEFFSKAYVDRVLHEMANARLDATIAHYGNAFYSELERYSSLSADAREFCEIPESVSLTYNPEYKEEHGKIECYWSDNGCAYKCLGAFAKQHETYDSA